MEKSSLLICSLLFLFNYGFLAYLFLYYRTQ